MEQKKTPHAAIRFTRMEDCFLPENDFPFIELESVRQKILFAATPRSGSTYICQQFWKTGWFGSPLEYTNEHLNNKFAKDVSFSGLTRAWNSIIQRRTSPNGVFSFKMFPWYFYEIINRFNKEVEILSFTDVIFIYRKDLLAQAISNVIASQTKRWFSIYKPQHTPIYDFNEILGTANNIKSQNEIWKRIFIEKSIDPILIPYEDFNGREENFISSSIAKLDIQKTANSLPPVQFPDLKIQRDYINEIWKKRFLNDFIKLYGNLALNELTHNVVP